MRALPAFQKILVVAVALAALASPSSSQLLPLGGSHHGPVNLPELTQRSAVIVRGTVSGVRSMWAGKRIVTEYDIAVMETVQGQARAQVTVVAPGGEVGIFRAEYVGVPKLSAGDELVFFGEAAAGGHFQPVGLSDGLVPIHPQPTGGPGLVLATGRPVAVDVFLQQVRAVAR